jgi:hypothetical protein
MWQVQPVALCVVLVNKTKSRILLELIKTVPELKQADPESVLNFS